MPAIKNSNYLTSLPGYSPQTLVMQGKTNKLLKPLALKKSTLSIFSSLYIFRVSDTPPLPLLRQYFPAFRNSVTLSRMSLSFIYSDLLSCLPYRFHFSPSGNRNHLHIIQSSLSFSHFPFRQRKPFTYRPVFLIVFTFPLPYHFHISPSGNRNLLFVIQSFRAFLTFYIQATKTFYLYL